MKLPKEWGGSISDTLQVDMRYNKIKHWYAACQRNMVMCVPDMQGSAAAIRHKNTGEARLLAK
jgi:hypothetical protein